MSDFKVVSVLNPTVVLTAGPAFAAGTQTLATGTLQFSNSNGVTFGLNNGTLTASVQAGAAAGIGQVNAGTTYASSGTLTFGSSAGNITFGMDNGYITGSAPAGGGGAYVFSNSNNVSFTNNNSTIVASASYPVQTAFVLSNSNGVSFGTNGSTVTASHNGLTTAAQSNHSHGVTLNLTNINGTTGGNSNGINLSLSAVVPSQTVQPVAYSAVNGSANFSTITFANSNGVSFSTGTQGLYATVKTDYLTTAQPVGNYATSDHTHGNIQFNLTGIGATANSASNGLTLSLSANVAGGGDGYNAAQFTNATANTTQNLLWAGNSNGSGNITIGLTGSTITASAPSGGGGVAINADASNYTSGTVSFGNSNGFSFKTTNGSIVGSYTVPTVPGATVFSNSNNVSFGLNGSTVTATATWPAQTVQPVAYSAANGSANFSTLTFANSNGVSFSTGTQGLYATVRTDYQSAGAYLTTARASNDAIGLNTAATQVTWTVNSNGISLNAGAYLTTAAPTNVTTNNIITANSSLFQHTSATSAITSNAAHSTHSHGAVAFTGTNVSASFTSQSNGLSIQLSAPTPGGGGAINVSAGTTSGNLQTIQFNDANGVSFGLNGSTITASVEAGGGGVTNTMWFPFNEAVNVMGQQGQGTLHLVPVPTPDIGAATVSFDRLCFPILHTHATNSTGSVTLSMWYGLYTREATTGTKISLAHSTSFSTGYTFSGTANSSILSGLRLITIPWTSSIAGNRYVVGIISRTTTGGANCTISQLLVSNLNSNFSGILGQTTNATYQWPMGWGQYSATTSALPASIAYSQIYGTNSNAMRNPEWFLVNSTA